MTRRRPYRDAAKKRDGTRFVTIPTDVLESTAYLNLSSHARMLLLDILVQYRGNNNGDLCAAWSFMKPRGWRSQATLAKAKSELLDQALIAETRKGGRPNRASLYALTWFALDDCGPKLEMTASAFPRGAWRAKDRPPLPSVIHANSNAYPVSKPP